LKALDDHKLRDNTIVVFLSDHGYHIGDLGLWGKTSCFEDDARVPLIVRAPKAAPQPAARAVVELIDLFPTLCELANLDAPKGLDGTSFAPVVRGKDGAKAVAFTQHPRPAYYDRTEKGIPDAMGYSARTADGRYTEWRDWATGKVLGAEFYAPSLPRGVVLDHRTNQFSEANPGTALKAARAALHKQFPPDVPPAKR
jgi:iduronate 2-sulfatase